ncbi:Protein CBG26252 [Caenorhabditis briggsae]|uniref:Protein CBG26252 n=1 Tax=Caenorhabditis briggsae TaxID=6238 RepID=B6ILX3_CAEBR|nr:Protein CBG26252 [Caenorhabditis briggsae]CAS00903.1 Protein CBG26252 [Caenorhabditis briggsae]
MTYTRFNTSQCKVLEGLYKKSPKPSVEERNKLAKMFRIDFSKITRWFERRNNKEKAEKKISDDELKEQEDPADDVVRGKPPPPQHPQPQDLNDFQPKNHSGKSRTSDAPKENQMNVVHKSLEESQKGARESEEDVVEIKKEVPEQNSMNLYREPKLEEIKDVPAPFWTYPPHNGPIKYPVAAHKEDQRKYSALIQKIRSQLGPQRTQNPAKNYYTNPYPTFTPGSNRQSLGENVQFNSYVSPRPSTSQEATFSSASNAERSSVVTPSLGPIRNKVNHSNQIRSAIYGKPRNYGQSHPYALHPLSNEETENVQRVMDAQKTRCSAVIKKEFAGTSTNDSRRLSSTTSSGSHASSSGISSSNTTVSIRSPSSRPSGSSTKSTNEPTSAATSVSLGSPSSGPMPTPSPVLPSERVFSNSHRAQELPLSTPSPAASKIPAPFEVLTVNKPGPDNKAPEVSCDVESLATSPGKVKTTEPIKLDQKEDSATEKKNLSFKLMKPGENNLMRIEFRISRRSSRQRFYRLACRRFIRRGAVKKCRNFCVNFSSQLLWRPLKI